MEGNEDKDHAGIELAYYIVKVPTLLPQEEWGNNAVSLMTTDLGAI